MIRASITRGEWIRLQQLALEQSRPPKDLVADAIRATYNLTNGESQ